jgi:fructose-specific component phosphotransferase system IIB-like protein
MGFAKLTLGELNPFTLGLLYEAKEYLGPETGVDYNIIRIRDYSTMYTSPNGYFFFFILLINLIGVRAFSQVKKEGDVIETKLPSRAEVKESRLVSRKRRRSIDEHDITQTRRKSVDLNLLENSDDLETPLNLQESMHDNPLESTKKFELFEKEFSVQSPENLSQADSNTTNVKSSSSMVFLEKFEKLKKPSSIIGILLKLKENELCIQLKEPKLVLFWMMTYTNFKRLSTILTIYTAVILYASGNAFTSDLMVAFLLSKVYARFYFQVLER